MTVEMLDTIIRGFFGSFIASLGFSILFNIRGKSIFYASLAGGIGGLVYNVLFNIAGINAVLSSFVGTAALTACAEAFARWLKMPVTTYLACALIPLVPGGDAYRMMVAFVEGKLYSGLHLALETISIAGVMALGILMVSAVTRLLFYSRKKAVQIGQLAYAQTKAHIPHVMQEVIPSTNREWKKVSSQRRLQRMNQDHETPLQKQSDSAQSTQDLEKTKAVNKKKQ